MLSVVLNKDSLYLWRQDETRFCRVLDSNMWDLFNLRSLYISNLLFSFIHPLGPFTRWNRLHTLHSHSRHRDRSRYFTRGQEVPVSVISLSNKYLIGSFFSKGDPTLTGVNPVTMYCPNSISENSFFRCYKKQRTSCLWSWTDSRYEIVLRKSFEELVFE